jgi:adenosine/AMP kinase
MAWEAVTASCLAADRPDFEYRYGVVVCNASSKHVHVDIFHTGQDKWISGDFGTLVTAGESTVIAVRDWQWMAWGGPRRVLNHVQDHPLQAVVHWDQGGSKQHEVKPWSTLTVGDDDVVVEHGDPAEGGTSMDERTAARTDKWTSFVAGDSADSQKYHYKYAVHVKNQGTKAIAADLVVRGEQHNLGAGRVVGFRGLCVLPNKEKSFLIPDFSWMAWGGPMRVLNHIQNHPLEVTVYADGAGGVPEVVHTGEVRPGSIVLVNADGAVSITEE